MLVFSNQNKLKNLLASTLLPMTMSQVYSVLPVAHLAYAEKMRYYDCEAKKNRGAEKKKFPHGTVHVLRMLQSFTRVVASI